MSDDDREQVKLHVHKVFQFHSEQPNGENVAGFPARSPRTQSVGRAIQLFGRDSGQILFPLHQLDSVWGDRGENDLRVLLSRDLSDQHATKENFPVVRTRLSLSWLQTFQSRFRVRDGRQQGEKDRLPCQR